MKYIYNFAGRKLTLLMALPIAGMALLGGRWCRDAYIPVREPLAHIPDPVKAGDVDNSIARMKRLITALKDVDWDPLKVPKDVTYFPDVKYYQDQDYCKDNIPPISFAHLRGFKEIPEYESVAFYSDLYVRSNIKIYKGDRATNDPTGFYLVGWKNGDVTRVSLNDIRWIKSKSGGRILSFPGMPGYGREEGLPDPMIRFARGGTDQEKREFFKEMREGSTDPICKGCAK